MSISNFFESIHCKSKAHCKTCRNLNGGQKWRIAVNGEVNPDFECPYGKKWLSKQKSKVKSKVKSKGCGGCSGKKNKFKELLKSIV